jgi:hypothetical protein
MSARRAELSRLVRDLPEDRVPGVSAAIRRDVQPIEERPWPPAFFASAPGDGKSIADEAAELLREGFGRQR